ncbi:acyl-CoA dehydrogenase family protein [Streptomyces catenulae]|uniref:Acyl-CoA dehydrogenase family protein n=1 Tax=Streptomyces catenulae TaxID=66875 RepID=A0ABV2Z495_9ACTN|nr:acyl-CoA dehydrogenase family protein [Streptomyces catenulae]
MDAATTEEQEEFRRTLRAHLRGGPHPDGEPGGNGDPDRGPETSGDAWRRLAARAGLAGAGLPAAYGGGGGGPVALAVACEETGRTLRPSPLFATAVLTAPLLLALGTERQRDTLLPRCAAGELTCATAVPAGRLGTALALTGPNGGDWAGGGRAGGLQARKVPGGPGRAPEDGGRWLLYGEAAQVLDGHTAGLLLVAAHTGGFARSRTRLFLVAAGAPGLRRIALPTAPGERPRARLELRQVEAELLGAEEAGAAAGRTPENAALAAVGAGAAAALAAETAGAADAVLSRAAARVRDGGAPAGEGARVAELHAAVRAVRAAAYGAAGAAEPGAGALALAQALQTQRAVAAQVAPPGDDGAAYARRAAGDELLLGPVHRLRERAAEEAGLFATGERGRSGPPGGSAAVVAGIG